MDFLLICFMFYSLFYCFVLMYKTLNRKAILKDIGYCKNILTDEICSNCSNTYTENNIIVCSILNDKIHFSGRCKLFERKIKQ